jgi:hypothetical protein
VSSNSALRAISLNDKASARPPDGLERVALPQVIGHFADAGDLDRLMQPDEIHARPSSFFADYGAETADEFLLCQHRRHARLRLRHRPSIRRTLPDALKVA